jgi:hypothetical protein
VLKKRGHRAHPALRQAGHPPSFEKTRQSRIFFFFVKHSFIKRTSAVYELPFVQITSLIQRYKIRVMHNSRLGGGRGWGIAFWAEDIKVLEKMKKEPLGLQSVASPSLLPREGLLHGNRLGWQGLGF